MASYSSPSYLLPLLSTVDLPEKTLLALQDIERQFDLPAAKLEEITEKMLWEAAKGLTEEPTDETRDTFM